MEFKMEFKDFKYMHVEHWDTDEVLHLKDSEVLCVQPKLDDTNCFVDYENDIVNGTDGLKIYPKTRVFIYNPGLVWCE